jgi:predicted Zn finger-like uncharacterized protein
MGNIMIITCEDCNTSFNLDESLLKPTGSKVRCSKCKKVFVAYPPQPLEEPEKEEVLDSEETVEKEVEDLDLDIEPEGERNKEEFTEDFEVEFESEAESAADETEVEAKVGEPDDLDLSDLEALLDDEEVPKEESVAEESVEDLDLEMDVESEVAEKAEEVEMDLEFEDSDTIDLTEIEAMLDEEESEIESIDELEEVELELDTETEFELERPTEELDAVAESDDMSEVDLSDIEKMLEEAIDADTEAELEGDELYGLDGLDLDTDTDELDEGIEIEDMDLGLEKEDSDQEDLIEDEVAEVQEIEKEVTDQFYMETQDLEKAVEEQLGADDLETEEDKEIPVVKKGLNKPVLVLLIILLLGGGGFGVYALVNYTNVEIPFISDYFKPKVQDPAGNLYIDTLDINSKFVENAREGKLFVVTGKVRNNYKGERSFISITGKLYRKGKILVSPWEKVFCGNALSDIELSNNDLEYLKNKLSIKNGENNSNVGVKPGQELPFMIIFANLPDDLEEFAIEVAGSSAG